MDELPKGDAKRIRGCLAAELRPFLETSEIIQTALGSSLGGKDSEVRSCVDYVSLFGDHVAEVFSPPRIVPVAKQQNLRASLSIDLVSGWDLLTPAGQDRAWASIRGKSPLVVILEPPCSMFSRLQNANPEFMSSKRGRMLLSMARKMLRFAMEIAEYQASKGAYFLFEHPSGASSWQEPCVQKVLSLRGVYRTNVHLCRFELRSPDGKQRLRKSTGLCTNLPWPIFERHLYKTCNDTCREIQHVPIQGSLPDSNGQSTKMSTHAQEYPPAFVNAIVKCVLDLRDERKRSSLDKFMNDPHRPALSCSLSDSYFVVESFPGESSDSREED